MPSIEVTAFFTNNGVPLTSPGDAPEVNVRRTDTGALVATAEAMTELGNGHFRYTFATADRLLRYVATADGDPNVTGQVTTAERYAAGVIDPSMEDFRKIFRNRVEVNITDTQVDVYEDDNLTIAFSFALSGDRRSRTVI